MLYYAGRSQFRESVEGHVELSQVDFVIVLSDLGRGSSQSPAGFGELVWCSGVDEVFVRARLSHLIEKVSVP